MIHRGCTRVSLRLLQLLRDNVRDLITNENKPRSWMTDFGPHHGNHLIRVTHSELQSVEQGFDARS